ncbi:outer membrane protein [uncultured Gammaproteobacteria bacterium]
MITKICRRLAGVAVVVAAMTAAATGQAGAQIKSPVVAVVDVQLILQESKAAQSIQKAATAQAEAYGKEIAPQEEKLRVADQELARLRTTLSQDAFAAKRRDFEKQIAEVQRNVQTRQRNLEQAVNEARQTLLKAMNEIIGEVAREKEVNLVLLKHVTMTFDNSADLTLAVLEKLNVKLPQVAIKIPPKSGK